MPIVSAIVIKPIKERLCETCFEEIEIGSPCLRIYGSAAEGDLNTVIYVHLDCTQSNHHKILAAKKRFELKEVQTICSLGYDAKKG